MSKYTIDSEARTVTFEFGEGIGETTVFEADSVTDEEIRNMLLLHGAKQKLVDGFADAASRPEGMTEAEYKAFQVDQRVAMLQRGDWTLRAEGGTSGPSMVIRALVEILDQPLEAVTKLWDDADKAKRKEIRKHPQFKEVYERMKAEAALARAEKAKGIAESAPTTNVADLLS